MTLSKLSLKKHKLVALHGQEQVVGGSGNTNCNTVCPGTSIGLQCELATVKASCVSCATCPPYC